MTVAMPVWDEMISPVLDTARMLRVYEVIGEEYRLLKEISLTVGHETLASVVSSNTDVLICGALSKSLEESLYQAGLEVHPWVMGEADTVLDCYRLGGIGEYEFSMPGCNRHRHRDRRCHGRKMYGGCQRNKTLLDRRE